MKFSSVLELIIEQKQYKMINNFLMLFFILSDSVMLKHFFFQSSYTEMPTADEGPEFFSQLMSVVHGISKRTTGPAVYSQAQNILCALGLLAFVSEKINHLNSIIEDQRVLSGQGNVSGMRNTVDMMLEFLAFILNGLLGEAARIDAAIFSVKRNIAVEEAKLQQLLEEMYMESKCNTVSLLHNVYAKKFTSTPIIIAKNYMGHSMQGHHLSQTRLQIKVLHRHLEAMQTVQSILRGRLSENENTEGTVRNKRIEAAVRGADLVATVQKLVHHIKDAIFDVPQSECLKAVGSLLKFIQNFADGMTHAIQDLHRAHLSVQHSRIEDDKEMRIRHLSKRCSMEQDRRSQSRARSLSTMILKQRSMSREPSKSTVTSHSLHSPMLSQPLAVDVSPLSATKIHAADHATTITSPEPIRPSCGHRITSPFMKKTGSSFGEMMMDEILSGAISWDPSSTPERVSSLDAMVDLYHAVLSPPSPQQFF